MSEPDPTRYRDIPGFPYYRAGTDGSIWSRRGNQGRIKDDWHRLKPTRQKRNGRLHVRFRRDGKSFNMTVHRAVMLAFVGPRPNGMHIAHNDGKPANNRLSNLRYATQAENEADKALHGTKSRGEKNGSAKLTAKKVTTIRAARVAGKTFKELASRFRISTSLIGRIVHREIWKHLPAQEVSR